MALQGRFRNARYTYTGVNMPQIWFAPILEGSERYAAWLLHEFSYEFVATASVGNRGVESDYNVFMGGAGRTVHQIASDVVTAGQTLIRTNDYDVRDTVIRRIKNLPVFRLKEPVNYANFTLWTINTLANDALTLDVVYEEVERI